MLSHGGSKGFSFKNISFTNIRFKDISFTNVSFKDISFKNMKQIAFCGIICDVEMFVCDRQRDDRGCGQPIAQRILNTKVIW